MQLLLDCSCSLAVSHHGDLTQGALKSSLHAASESWLRQGTFSGSLSSHVFSPVTCRMLRLQLVSGCCLQRLPGAESHARPAAYSTCGSTALPLSGFSVLAESLKPGRRGADCPFCSLQFSCKPFLVLGIYFSFPLQVAVCQGLEFKSQRS